MNEQTDVFFISYSIIGIVLVFVDVFDSLGVPRLVRARSQGWSEFYEEASSLFTFSLLSAVSFGLFLLFLSFFFLFMDLDLFNFDPKLISANLILMLPFALAGFLIHFYGAVLRSMRRFTVYFLGEVAFSFLSFFFTFIGLLTIKSSYVLAVSLSISQLIFLSYIIIVSRKNLKTAIFPLRNFKDYIIPFLYLSVLYGIFYVMAVTDKLFASFLETKSVSAVTYGLLVVTTIKAIFRIEQIFITKFSEIDADPGYVIKSMLYIFLFSSIIFIIVFSIPGFIIKMLFGYGNFTPLDVSLVSTALKYYSISIPFLFMWSIVFRVFQILEKLGFVIIAGLTSLGVNIFLNYLFVFVFKMGITGICFATSITYMFLTLFSLLFLIRIYYFSLGNEKID